MIPQKTNHFIKNVYVNEVSSFWKTAGGVGVMIYNYIKYRIGVDKYGKYRNGVPLSNKYFNENSISRSSKYLALKKLKNNNLISIIERKGAAPLVKFI